MMLIGLRNQLHQVSYVKTAADANCIDVKLAWKEKNEKVQKSTTAKGLSLVCHDIGNVT